jgi:chemotaxis protein methyltransferase CheR
MTLDIQPFKALVKEHCGLVLDANGDEKLRQALTERILALAIQPAAYYSRLLSEDAEFKELINLLTINETYFFREPEQIRLLVDRLAPRLLTAHGGMTPVRILSAGCSSGEEPYSLVMALMDKYGESVAHLFSFAAGDIDSTVLAKAREGRYTDFSFRGVSSTVRNRYFDKDKHSNLLKEHIKNRVVFHELNLLADTFPPALSGFDVIFFRNVSIYFDTPTRKIIQQNLASLLKQDGFLVIGTAETLANDLGVLPLVEEDGLFYFIKGQPPLAEATSPLPLITFDAVCPPPPTFPPAADFPSLTTLPLPAGTWNLSCPPVPIPEASLDKARKLTADRRYDDALPLLDTVLLAEPDNTEARLLKAYVQINRKDFAAAEALAQRVLAADTWSIDALIVLGLAAKWRNQNEAAIRAFKQAAYACHDCWPAHYYLADLYRHSGESELARRAYRVVVQLLSGSELNPREDAAQPSGIKYLPLGLPAKEVRFLCEHQLTKLPTGKVTASGGQR